jgi:hypothetical protein
MWLRRLAPLLVAPALLLAACEQGTDDACTPVQESYRVSASLSVHESVDAQGKMAEVEDPIGRVLASVTEDTSIISCGGGLVGQQTPGVELVSSVPVNVDETGFALTVNSTVYPELGDASALSLRVVLDENGNGRCDDGEPSGGSVLPRAARAHVSVELKRQPCLHLL